jgi:hypothetical protein
VPWSALGAKHLARRDSKVLGHIGARGTAYWNVRLIDHLFDCSEIRVHSRRPESRRAFADKLSQDLGKPVVPTDDWESCVRGADIVVEASRLPEPQPLLRTDWIKPGALVIPYGTMSAVEITLTDIMSKISSTTGASAERACRSVAAAPSRRRRPAARRQPLRGTRPDRRRRQTGARARRRDDSVLAPRPRYIRHRARLRAPRQGEAHGPGQTLRFSDAARACTRRIRPSEFVACTRMYDVTPACARTGTRCCATSRTGPASSSSASITPRRAAHRPLGTDDLARRVHVRIAVRDAYHDVRPLAAPGHRSLGQ